MKKILVSASALMLVAAPAYAAKITLTFTPDEGDVSVWVLDNETNMASNGDMTVPYTWDEASKTLCAVTEEGDLCATVETTSETPALGDTAAYTSTNGDSGTVEITGMED